MRRSQRQQRRTLVRGYLPSHIQAMPAVEGLQSCSRAAGLRNCGPAVAGPPTAVAVCQRAGCWPSRWPRSGCTSRRSVLGAGRAAGPARPAARTRYRSADRRSRVHPARAERTTVDRGAPGSRARRAPAIAPLSGLAVDSGASGAPLSACARFNHEPFRCSTWASGDVTPLR